MTGYRVVTRLIFALAFLSVAVVAGQGENRAAVVVDYGDGRTAAQCVAFAEPEITGLEALARSGLAVETDVQAAGAAVCRIDSVGCAADDCFCQCRGEECRYWSYWQLRDSEWRYAVAGASRSRVIDGSVEGWTWGVGTVTEATPPPVVSFAEVCATGATATEASPAPITPLAPYLAFGGLLLLVGGLALLGRRRATERAAT